MAKMKVLLVYKKSLYDLYNRHLDDPHIRSYMEDNGLTRYNIIKDHELHNDTLRIVTEFLEKHVNLNSVYRANVSDSVNGGINEYDLIVTVGGDGTLLHTAGYVKDVPVVGVNSSVYIEEDGEQKGSRGYFSGIMRTDDLDERLTALLDGAIPIVQLNRLEARLNKQAFERLVLNEFFIAHQNPASGTLYRVEVSDIVDEQGSSGLMIATPQQSWAIKAGGEVLPLDGRVYQLVAREKYKGDYDVIVINENVATILSRTRQGKIYVDGSHDVHDFTLGYEFLVGLSNCPLQLIGFDTKRRMKYARKEMPVVRTV